MILLRLPICHPPRLLLSRLPNASSFLRSTRDVASKTQPILLPLISRPSPHWPRVYISGAEGLFHLDGGASAGTTEDLGPDGEVFRKTLRLVECAMLASVSGLLYILSNTLAIENYFGCFFSLPIVISSMRWGLAAGRKTMVATAMLLLTLSGPVKAITYLLMHGFVGLAMGSLWSLGVDWSLSIMLCTIVRAMGAVGYVLLSSFFIRENILYLITINLHGILMGVLAATGVNTMLSMNTIYSIFGVILLINCGSFILLLHILYAIFFSKLGMKDSLVLPKWMGRVL